MNQADLARLEKLCPEYGVIWNDNVRYYEDGENIPVTGSQMRAIADCILRLGEENEALIKLAGLKLLELDASERMKRILAACKERR